MLPHFLFPLRQSITTNPDVPAAPGNSGGGTVKQISIGYLSTMYHTSHLIRAQRWLEKELKILPEWRLFPTGPAMVEAFAGGLIDLGYIGLPPAMIGIDKGVPLVCIAGGHAEGTAMIAASRYRSYDTLQSNAQVLNQFTGKRLGSPTRGSIHDVIIRNLVEESGLKISIANYPWTDLVPEAIEAGEIEGAVGTPALAVLGTREYGTATVIPPCNLWPFNPSYGIVVRKELLPEKKLLGDFLTLHERACNQIRLQPEEAAAVVADTVKVVDSSFVMEVFTLSPKYCSALPGDYRRSTMAFVKPLKKLGYLTGDLSEEDIFDMGIIDAIHPEPDHYSQPGRLISPPYI
jgi:NitT/TauT family transport system substrate-binding protein